MIGLLLSLLGSIPPKISKAALIGISIALVIVASYWWGRGDERKSILESPADTTLTKRVDSLRLVIRGLNVRLDAAQGDIEWYGNRVDELNDSVRAKSAAAGFYRRLADSLEQGTGRVPVASFLRVVDTWWHNWWYKDTLAGEYHYPPVNEFRNIRAGLQDRKADTVLIRYDTTITRTIPAVRSLLSLRVDFDMVGLWSKTFLAMQENYYFINLPVAIQTNALDIIVRPVGVMAYPDPGGNGLRSEITHGIGVSIPVLR